MSKVCYLFNLDSESLFTKTKRRDIVDARHLLYFLCSQRPMRLVYIQEYMAENGYNINHSSIHHGIAQVKKKVEDDADWNETIESILSEV